MEIALQRKKNSVVLRRYDLRFCVSKASTEMNSYNKSIRKKFRESKSQTWQNELTIFPFINCIFLTFFHTVNTPFSIKFCYFSVVQKDLIVFFVQRIILNTIIDYLLFLLLFKIRHFVEWQKDYISAQNIHVACVAILKDRDPKDSVSRPSYILKFSTDNALLT